MLIKKQEVMFKKYSLFVAALFILTTFSSCGFISMDLSGAANQFTDFSPEDSNEVIEDCGCEGPKRTGNCTYIGAPVCGCDGITYGNACFARRNGIYIYRRGECGKPYPVNRPIILPASPPIVNPQPINSQEVKPWPTNPRKPAKNKLPSRGEATIVQTKEHKRK